MLRYHKQFAGDYGKKFILTDEAMCIISNTFSRIPNLVDTYCNYSNSKNDQNG